MIPCSCCNRDHLRPAGGEAVYCPTCDTTTVVQWFDVDVAVTPGGTHLTVQGRSYRIANPGDGPWPPGVYTVAIVVPTGEAWLYPQQVPAP